MKTLSLTALVMALTTPLSAGETPWQDVAPDVRMRLISNDMLTQNGRTWVGIEIAMPADTKTYWRVPGESGIPPVFDFSASAGVGGHAPAWPVPKRDISSGYLDHAYYGHVVLPIELEIVEDSARLGAQVTLGICSDVCIPVTASFSHTMAFSAPDNAQSLRINQALASVPLPYPDDNVLGEAVLDTTRKTLTVEIDDPTFEGQEIIADIAGQPTLFGVPEYQDADQALVFPLYGKISGSQEELRRVHFTFTTSDGPYEIVRDLIVR